LKPSPIIDPFRYNDALVLCKNRYVPERRQALGDVDATGGNGRRYGSRTLAEEEQEGVGVPIGNGDVQKALC